VRKDHPANRIMRDFYHRIKLEEGPHAVPHILGLTASPTYGSRKRELDVVESSLDAITVTPQEHQLELSQFVNHPLLSVVEYSEQLYSAAPQMLTQLLLMHKSCKPKTIEHSVKFSTFTSEKEEKEILLKQLSLLSKRAFTIFQELGSWATKHYLLQTLLALERSQRSIDATQTWDDAKPQLLNLLSKHIDHSTLYGDEQMEVSPKVMQLIRILKNQEQKTIGVIFVEQRVTVGVLSELLSRHPETKDRYRNATFVGQKLQHDLDELLDIKNQDQSLKDFPKLSERLSPVCQMLKTQS